MNYTCERFNLQDGELDAIEKAQISLEGLHAELALLERKLPASIRQETTASFHHHSAAVWPTCLWLSHRAWESVTFTPESRHWGNKLKELENKRDDRDRLQEELGSLISRRRRVGQQSAPVMKVPVDLLARIFLLCLPEADFIIPNPLEAPLLLCRVCRIWKDTAIDTPRLWASLSIPKNGAWRDKTWVSCLKKWLDRSREASSLSLGIFFPMHLHHSIDHYIIQSIFVTAPRWRHVRLNMSDHLLNFMVNTPLPNLQTLEIERDTALFYFSIGTEQAPELQSISLLTPVLHPDSLAIPWQQLTHFSSNCPMDVDKHIKLLLLCPLITSYGMSLDNLHFRGSQLDNRKRITISHLTSLRIVSLCDRAMGDFLDSLELHCLSELALIAAEGNKHNWLGAVEGWPKLQVLALVNDSRCTLRSLRVEGCISEETIDSARRLIPSLSSVYFSADGTPSV